ncbi:hypothetical protein MMPV_006225 [Pyropia vietnamensis]
MEQVLQMRGAWDVLHHPRPIVPDRQSPPVAPDNNTDAGVDAPTGHQSSTAHSGDAVSSAHPAAGSHPRAPAGDGAPTPELMAAQQAAARYAAALQQHRQVEALHVQASSAAREWDRQNVVARGLIILSLDPVHQLVARRHTAAKDIWVALERDFRSRGMARAAMLQTQLDTLKKGSKEAMLEYAARARTIQWELTELGEQASDRAVLIAILNGLPHENNVTKGIWKDKSASMEEAMPTLITAEQRILMKATRTATAPVENV